MLFGAAGQCLTMVLLAILGSIDNSASQIVSAVLLFVFNSFFAIGWLGMTWLYASRIPRYSQTVLTQASYSPLRSWAFVFERLRTLSVLPRIGSSILWL